MSTRKIETYREPLRSSKEGHEHSCVFTKLLKEDHLLNDEPRVPHSAPYRSAQLDEDPRKQYLAVQQGHDIPLKGLRKAAPQPNMYKGKLFLPIFIDKSLGADTVNRRFGALASVSLHPTRFFSNLFRLDLLPTPLWLFPFHYHHPNSSSTITIMHNWRHNGARYHQTLLKPAYAPS